MAEDQSGRSFIRNLGLAGTPLMFAGTPMLAFQNTGGEPKGGNAPGFRVNFILDDLFYTPSGNLDKLAQIDRTHPIAEDIYGEGGVTASLEKEDYLSLG